MEGVHAASPASHDSSGDDARQSERAMESGAEGPDRRGMPLREGENREQQEGREHEHRLRHGQGVPAQVVGHPLEEPELAHAGVSLDPGARDLGDGHAEQLRLDRELERDVEALGAPDGHALEILSFPDGKGLPKWHRPGTRLFLGIDHTAIVVSDTDASLRFYRDALGLRVAGSSDNHGVEQERLNNVEGAHLRITALRGASGPGVEFLEYLNPHTGRPAPADARSDDLTHWETVVAAGGLSALAERLRSSGISFISPAVVHAAEGRAALVRDPDGHAVRLVEKTS